MLKKLARKVLSRFGYQIYKVKPLAAVHAPEPLQIPDAEFYKPNFSPWRGYGGFKELYEVARPYTLVSADRCYVLYTLASQALRLPGDWWECGVYRGGTARLLSRLLADADSTARLRLFDTFEGLPPIDPEKDLPQRDFADTSPEEVLALMDGPERVHMHKGLMPDTFKGLEDSRIAFAHIDVDIYKSVIDCCEFIYPRLVPGAFMVFDDYGFSTCPGARRGVEEFFCSGAVRPLALHTGQAIVFASFNPADR